VSRLTVLQLRYLPGQKKEDRNVNKLNDASVIACVIIIECMGLTFLYFAIKYKLEDNDGRLLVPESFTNDNHAKWFLLWIIPFVMYFVLKPICSIKKPPNPFSAIIEAIITRAKERR